MPFETIQGVVLGRDALKRICSCYKPEENGFIDSILSAELIKPFLQKAVKLLPEPHFFFLEIPCTEQEEADLRKSKTDPTHYNVYYLDGCTEPVTQAIIKRYGELLINDGLTRFGFGSNKTGEEIYVLDYQQINVYSDNGRFEKVYKELGIIKSEKVVTPWENFTHDNVGISIAVEIEGEQCSDIPLNLKKEGMYLAETRENQ